MQGDLPLAALAVAGWEYNAYLQQVGVTGSELATSWSQASALTKLKYTLRCRCACLTYRINVQVWGVMRLCSSVTYQLEAIGLAVTPCCLYGSQR
jgi:hypothetical protein